MANTPAKKITYDGKPVQVESAVRDGTGKTISSTYSTKAETVTDVSYDSSSKKIQKTINGTTTDVVTLATVATSGSYSDLSSQPTVDKVQQRSWTSNSNQEARIAIKSGINDNNITDWMYFVPGVTINGTTKVITAGGFKGPLRGGNNKQFFFGGITSFRVTGNVSTDPVAMNQTNNNYWRICSITKDQYIANNRSWHVKLRIVCVNTSNTRYTADDHSTSVACNIAIRHDFVVEFNASKTGGNTTILNDTDTGRGSGIYAIRTLMPKNDSYGPQIELYKWYSNTTTVDDNFKAAGTDCQVYVYVLEDDVGLTWENNANNKPTTTSYNSSYYNQTTLNVGQYNENFSSHKYNINIRGGCDGTAGWANGAWDRLDNDRYYYGEAVVAGSLVALSPDGLMWKLRNTNKTFSLPLHFGRCTGTFAAGANYGRVERTARGIAYSEISNATMQGTAFTVPTLTSTSTSSTDYGKQLYMRGTLDGGNFKPDGTIALSMSAGYTWVPIGKVDYTNVGIATAPSTWTLDGYNANAYTIDSNGKLTHVNGISVQTTAVYERTTNSSTSTTCTLIQFNATDYKANGYLAHFRFRVRSTSQDAYPSDNEFSINYSYRTAMIVMLNNKTSASNDIVQEIYAYFPNSDSYIDTGNYFIAFKTGRASKNFIIEVMEADVPYTVPATMSASTTTNTSAQSFAPGQYTGLYPLMWTGTAVGNISGSAGSVAWTNVSGRPTVPNITISDQTPSGGSDGDIWIQYWGGE